MEILCVIFMKPISFYVTILSHGFSLTKIQYYITTDKTRYGKSSIYIVNRENEKFNLILLSNVKSHIWHMQTIGVPSTETKPYSWIKWDKWEVNKDGILSTRTHKTIIYKKESKIKIDTEQISTSLDCEISQFKDFTIVDIYTKTPLVKELDNLDITELIIEK